MIPDELLKKIMEVCPWRQANEEKAICSACGKDCCLESCAPLQMQFQIMNVISQIQKQMMQRSESRIITPQGPNPFRGN